MQPGEHAATHLLGYRIEQIRPCDQPAPVYQVICPLDGNVLAQFPDLPSAERYILQRELPATSNRPRHPVY